MVEIAAGHQETGPRWFETYVSGTEHHWENLLIAEGYQAVQYRFHMVRHSLTKIPDLPLPASELLVQVLNASPDPITLFVSGTHTNLAGALRLDPGIVAKIASVHVMGGALYVPGNIAAEWPAIENHVAEWNIWVDSLAAAEVFGAGLSIHLTPLDATNRVVWTEEEAARWAASGTPEGQLAAEILRWYLDYLRDMYPDGVLLWDLVSAVHTTHPALCRQEEVHIQIVTQPGEEQGRTRVVADRLPNTTAYLAPRADEIKRVATQILGLPRQTR